MLLTGALLTKSPGTTDARRRRFWLTVSEVVGVLALAIAGLNFWETRREHVAADRHAAVQAQAQATFVMTGVADGDGRRIVLSPITAAQAIQSQRYIFPSSVLDHPMEVSAARPQVDEAWIDQGLRQALDAVHAKGAGEAELPVGVVTTYVEDGDTRTDRSLYQVGFAYRTRFLVGTKITLQGLSLARRGVGKIVQADVDRLWKHDQHAIAPGS